MVVEVGHEAELGEDARDMCLDRLLGDEQPLRDGLIRAPFRLLLRD
jgi:hypothetical protein